MFVWKIPILAEADSRFGVGWGKGSRVMCDPPSFSLPKKFKKNKTVCPCCGNSLTVSRGPGTDEFPHGQNKLECRTCPYQFAIERRYYERKEMKRKEVEDVMGGKDAWANVDKTDGERASCPFFFFFFLFPPLNLSPKQNKTKLWRMEIMLISTNKIFPNSTMPS